MAKIGNSIEFKNAEISLEDDTITEYDKDGSTEYKLSDILHRCEGHEGVALSIRWSNTLIPHNDEDDKCRNSGGDDN